MPASSIIKVGELLW